MKLFALVAPLFVLAACSPPAADAPAQPVQMSAEARSNMDQINSANFASLSQVPAIPESAVPASTTASMTPAAATTAEAPQDQALEANVPPGASEDQQFNLLIVRTKLSCFTY